jgi:membrane protein DedA with SNARE-associated domain
LEVTLIFDTVLAQMAAVIDNPFILFGLLFIFAAVNLFFPPIPLESAALFSGCLSATGHGSLIIVITATAGGMFASSLALYQITRSYGTGMLEKTPLKKYLTSDSYRKVLQWFKKYGLYTIFLGKLVPGMSLYTVICCGLLRLDAVKALPAILLSNLFFFTALVMIGRLLGANWNYALPWLTQVGPVSLIFMAIFSIYVIIHYFSDSGKKDG